VCGLGVAKQMSRLEKVCVCGEWQTWAAKAPSRRPRVVDGLMPGLPVVLCLLSRFQSRPQPKAAMLAGCSERERRGEANTASPKQGDLVLPIHCLSDQGAEVDCVGCVHHVEVVATHDTELHVLLAAELGPAVVTELGAVVEQPGHGSRVLLLSGRGTGVTGVSGNTFTAPDCVGRDGLQCGLRFIG
jgi:hypothetical protein